jgi:hypothetical protein
MNHRTTPPGKQAPALPTGPVDAPPKPQPGTLSRTRAEDVTFAHPFTLHGESARFPAGAYTVATEEELIQGLSFPAYRRVATTLSAAGDRSGSFAGVTEVDPRALAQARREDLAATQTRLAAADTRPGERDSARPSRLRPRPAGALRAWRGGHRA